MTATCPAAPGRTCAGAARRPPTLPGRPLRLSRDELASSWQALDLGDPHYLLRLAEPGGLTVDDGRRHGAGVLAGMAERGLAEGGVPVPALAEWLRLFAVPSYRLDIRFPGPDGRAVLGLAAVAGGRGVVLLGTEGTGPIELAALDSTQVIGALLGLLGPLRLGRGNPVSIPAGLLDDAVRAVGGRPDTAGGVWVLADELRALGLARAEASSLARMCSGITFGARLGASGLFGGPERRGGWLIGCHRTADGEFMVLRKDGAVTVAPTDGARLALRWRELVDSLHPGAT